MGELVGPFDPDIRIEPGPELWHGHSFEDDCSSGNGPISILEQNIYFAVDTDQSDLISNPELGSKLKTLGENAARDFEAFLVTPQHIPTDTIIFGREFRPQMYRDGQVVRYLKDGRKKLADGATHEFDQLYWAVLKDLEGRKIAFEFDNFRTNKGKLLNRIPRLIDLNVTMGDVHHYPTELDPRGFITPEEMLRFKWLQVMKSGTPVESARSRIFETPVFAGARAAFRITPAVEINK